MFIYLGKKRKIKGKKDNMIVMGSKKKIGIMI